ncbi:MAG: NADP-dependent oxidoreductase [Henriciella sp.]|jgi:NADPH-dependent curcumin reductase CurA
MARQVRLTDYPDGQSARSFWAFSDDDLPHLNENEIKLRIDLVSVDPGMSGWITNKPSYMPPVKPGAVMRAFGVGEVVESRSERLQLGDWVTGFLGLQTEAVVSHKAVRKIDTTQTQPQLFLSGLGMTGYTAYFGMLDIGRPKEGDTVVVSAASGAVGSIASQLAKQAGARVIGIAGGPVKCAYLTDVLGLDAAIDYKASNVGEALDAAAPDGIDLFFDNVGGDILDCALERMNYRGRIVVCGSISQYADFSAARGPANYMRLVTHSLTMQGFTMRDYMQRVPEALAVLAQGHADGSLKFREHVLEGLKTFPDAYEMLFDGRNHGKLLIDIRGDH